MIHFLPREQATSEPVTPSLHGRLNNAISDLGAICTGVTGETLYFEMKSPKSKVNDELARAIIQRLLGVPEIAEWIRKAPITGITIR